MDDSKKPEDIEVVMKLSVMKPPKCQVDYLCV